MNAFPFTFSIFNSAALYLQPKVNQFLTDRQKVLGGLALTFFSFIAASYLFHRHWLARRVLAQNPVREAPLNARVERIVQERLPRTDEEREEALDGPNPFANLSSDVMEEIFNQLGGDPNIELVSRQWRAVFQERSYRRLFQSYQDNPHLSALCAPIQAQPHLTDKEKVQALYQAVIDLTLRTEGGKRAKQETASLYSHTLSTERLSHLVHWTQAVNLTKVFTKIALQLPIAQTFLDEIREKDLIDQAEDIRLWMSNHPTDLASISNLSLNFCRLSELPKEIGQLTQLQQLDLSYNRLTTLPAAIGQLTQLQDLNLSENQLTALPAAIGQLTQLQELGLFNTQLAALPAAIGQLTQLKVLYLGNNQLITLPAEIGRLIRLERLYLDGNQLTNLPAAIGQLTQLQHLCLSDNQLIALPAAIGQLTRLETLTLSNNQLTTLPAAIGRLTQLQYLYLSNNQLTNLPAAIGWLIRLRWLYLDSNQLTTLPAAIGQLMQLQKLYVYNNQLTALPIEIQQLPHLWVYWMNRNSSCRASECF